MVLSAVRQVVRGEPTRPVFVVCSPESAAGKHAAALFKAIGAATHGTPPTPSEYEKLLRTGREWAKDQNNLALPDRSNIDSSWFSAANGLVQRYWMVRPPRIRLPSLPPSPPPALPRTRSPLLSRPSPSIPPLCLTRLRHGKQDPRNIEQVMYPLPKDGQKSVEVNLHVRRARSHSPPL